MANTIAKRVFMTRPSPAEKVSQCHSLRKDGYSFVDAVEECIYAVSIYLCCQNILMLFENTFMLFYKCAV